MLMGQMMQRPLLISQIIDYAAEAHRSGTVMSRRCEGDDHRLTYPELRARVVQLSHALEGMGVKPGDRIATLAWNGHRHLELYYAIQSIGAVCHTINPRLSAEQLIYITRHAGDVMLFTDLTFVPLLDKLKPNLPDMRYVIMTDRAHMPDNTLDAGCYEELLDGQPTDRVWPEFDENTAAGLCYTSGTTGEPKGTLYSHRSNVLHALLTQVVLGKDLGEGCRILPVVPLFHVNAWGLPYLAPLLGANLVMPGPHLDGASLWDVMDREGVESAWGVPTIWQGLLVEMNKRGGPPRGFRHMVVGGSSAPRSMIEAFEDHGVDVNHAWGMTEMSPIGSMGNLPAHLAGASRDQQMAAKATQGRRVYGVDFKIVDENGQRQPHDGVARGELFVRGNTVMASYYNNADATAKAVDADGWFGTGDVATITADGFLQLRDRAKDLIKSGGEWISSIDLENVVAGHPKVAQAAVIAVAHPKWDERPLLVVVPRDDADRPTMDEVREMLKPHVASWQFPDDMVFIEAMPLTATGKISKLTLRDRFREHVLPDVGA